MKSWRSLIPNLLTLSNLACGLWSIISIFQEAYVEAVYFLIASLIFDFFDGFAARLLKVSSKLGLQLDSLADLVSFGLCPGYLMYHIIASSSNLNGMDWLPITALAIPLFSAWRLAVFNIDDRQSEVFIGLPTPANAIMIFVIALFPIISDNEFLLNYLTQPLFLAIIALISAIFLVAPIPLISLKFKNTNWTNNKGRYILLLSIALLLLILRLEALVFIIPLYLLISIIFKPSTA